MPAQIRTRKPAAILVSLLLLMAGAGAYSEMESDLETGAAERRHHRNSGFVNFWNPEGGPGLISFLKWRFTPNRYSREKENPPDLPVVVTPVREVLAGGDSITALGHATVWVRLNGKNILTDPVVGDVWNIRRHARFPVPPDQLPNADYVLISHSHYDHLDKTSIRRLGYSPVYLTPLGYREWFASVLPGSRVVELDWFQKYDGDGVVFRLLPVQHWTKRTPFDTNRKLWGAWLIEGRDRKIFFGGDSGYFHGFREFGKKFGPIDAAILPIGAYEPRWFMKYSHMNPPEAVQAFLDLRAGILIPQQWGVFDLSDEPLDQPVRHLLEAARTAGFPEDRIVVPNPGGTWYFNKEE